MRLRQGLGSVRRSLILRVAIASAVLAAIIGVGFGVLLVTIDSLRGSAQRGTRAWEELSSAAHLERVVSDLETGQRGFIITRRQSFLGPWDAARAEFPAAAKRLEHAVDSPEESDRARRIARDVEAYIRDYSIPLVRAARRNDPSAASIRATDEGKRRMDALRAELDGLVAPESAVLTADQRNDNAAAMRAVVVASAGLGGSIVLVLLFGGYLTRAIVVPVRRVASMAGALAGGDLAVRTPETDVGELGQLARAFNAMGASLEESRDQLRRLADEQAALRRVATLVAQAERPAEVFETVTREVGLISGADLARMERYEPDGTVTAVAAWSREPDVQLAVGTRFTLEGTSIAAQVRQTGRPARVDTFAGAAGPIAAEARQLGIRSSVGCPIAIGGEVWGVIAASSRREAPFPAATEAQICEFTELVATAVSNAAARAELAASRARILSAGDDARRRVVRDLHDGAQQRLVYAIVALKLAQGSLEPGDPAAPLVAEALAATQEGNAELRELAHGILPGALTRGGLRAGVNALVARLSLSVNIDIPEERYASDVEANAYFVIAEALTNTVKHAKARHVDVRVWARDGELHVEIRDDGVGGAGRNGTRVVALEDRIAAVGGTLRVDSPPSRGTLIAATMPLSR